ncbi:Heterokaryon incompatibility protein 6,OR allele [Lachnellula occidentalis]|uniref:Heterokaryon incompatibility protein 6,OR allele n=1 Tax=Lachnellula occidentalis TaxID=215460 RepID=A0A8H8UAH2_9HELO|nr:Heterokaryon incompatibility protein 6,OR allele [Lachnellula occidentalis]
MPRKAEQVQDHQLFEYSPLDTHDIRLLELLPSLDFDAEIHCTVSHSSLEKHPPYEALSYVWGDSNYTTSVQADGRPHHVTKNLELALRHLRLRENRRLLWVDAICINQQDVLEKNDQVGQMRRIYLGAEKVIVWLGEEENAGIALKFCSLIQNGVSISRFQKEVGKNGLTIEEVWSSCNSLFGRPWWTRTWVLQEVIHSRPATVYIGNIQLDLDDLCAKYSGYQGFKHTHNSIQRDHIVKFDIYSSVFRIEAMISTVEIIGWRREQRMTSEENHDPIISMLSAMHMSRFQQCQDARDKIYGLCGLIGDVDVTIDYSLSKSELYSSTMKQMLLRYPESLLLVESPERKIDSEKLPSWVPDWTTSRSLVPAIMSFWANEAFCCSGGSDRDSNEYMDFKPKFHLENSTLVMRAVQVGTITRTSFIEVTFGIGEGYQDTMKVFAYDKNEIETQNTSDQNPLHKPAPSTMTMNNSS